MKHLSEFLKKSLLTGILIVVPVIGSTWLLIIFVGWVDSLALQVWSFLGIPQSWNPNLYLPFELPVFGLLTASIALIFVGAMARLYFVNYFISLGERLIHKIPLLSSLYKGIKQFMNTLFANRKDRFNKVVLVEFPKEGVYSVGFVTGISQGALQQKTVKKDYNVFMPTCPNPTSGFFMMYPEDAIIELDMSVEDAFKIIISGGILTPPIQKKKLDQ